MYTDAGYKAQRFVAPLELRQPEGAPLPVLCAGKATLPGDLLLVSPATAFLAGAFQQAPDLEDLHASLLEDGLTTPQRRVLDILDTLRPAPAAAPSEGASAAAGEAAATTAGPRAPLPSLATLDPRFWAGRGKDSSAPAFSSRRLMSLLGRVTTTGESQDPASSQARHEKPLGYVGVWPELPLLGHSCLPNTSQAVVADRLFMHAIDELPAGTPLTRNLIGDAIAAPLPYRQAAVEEAYRDMGIQLPADASQGSPEGSEVVNTGGPCRCKRCVTEASVSEELRDALETAYSWYVNEAGEVWSRANEAEDMAMLRGLLSECETLVAEVEEAVQGEQGLDDEQQDWLRAGCYDVYDFLVTLDELVNRESADPDYLQTCVELIRVIAPGSDNHCLVALKNEALRQNRFEVFSELLRRERGPAKKLTKADRRKLDSLARAADTASEFRIEAIIQRYGYVTEDIMEKLGDGMETYMDGLEQMSAMAAQGLTEMTREIEVDGVRVQIVDKLEVSEGARVGGMGGGGRELVNEDGIRMEVVEGQAARAGEELEVMGEGEELDIDAIAEQLALSGDLAEWEADEE